MGEAARQDVLGQKATAARRAFEARAMSPAKALRRALSRTADVLWDLALVTHGVSQELMDQDGVVETLPPDTLLLLLDGPDGALGIAAIDREVMTGLIEVQTILQVTQMPADDRPLTHTDAAMMSPLIDGTMERVGRYLEEHPLRAQLEGFRYGAMIEDSRAAGLLLDAAGYRVFRVSVDLALGRRKGDILFALPERSAADLRASTDTDATEGKPGPHEKKMKLLPLRLDAVLCRMSLPLSAAQAIKPGDLLTLPSEALHGVALHSTVGTAVAGGRLGQINGMRAVRLTWPEGAARDHMARDHAEEGAPEASFVGTSGPKPQHAPAQAAAIPEPAPDIPEENIGGDLPDLPPMEFDTGDFSFDAASFDGMEGAGNEADSDAMDFDFASAPMDIEEET